MSVRAWLAIALVAAAGVFVGLRIFGARRWAGATRALTPALEAARVSAHGQPALPARYDARELAGLPAPVQRYFRAALRDGQPFVAAVSLDQAGTIDRADLGRSGLDPAGWPEGLLAPPCHVAWVRIRVVTRRPGRLQAKHAARLFGSAQTPLRRSPTLGVVLRPVEEADG